MPGDRIYQLYQALSHSDNMREYIGTYCMHEVRPGMYVSAAIRAVD